MLGKGESRQIESSNVKFSQELIDGKYGFEVWRQYSQIGLYKLSCRYLGGKQNIEYNVNFLVLMPLTSNFKYLT